MSGISRIITMPLRLRGRPGRRPTGTRRGSPCYRCSADGRRHFDYDAGNTRTGEALFLSPVRLALVRHAQYKGLNLRIGLVRYRYDLFPLNKHNLLM
jgi:hypothetical protein